MALSLGGTIRIGRGSEQLDYDGRRETPGPGSPGLVLWVSRTPGQGALTSPPPALMDSLCAFVLEACLHVRLLCLGGEMGQVERRVQALLGLGFSTCVWPALTHQSDVGQNCRFSQAHICTCVHAHVSTHTQHCSAESVWGRAAVLQRSRGKAHGGRGRPTTSNAFPRCLAMGREARLSCFLSSFHFPVSWGDPSLLWDVWSSKSLITAFCH